MKYLADTDYLVDLYRGNNEAMSKLKQLNKSSSHLYTTSINAAELFEGAYKSHNVSTSLLKVQTLLEAFNLLDFSINHAKNFGELISRLKGQEIGDMDTLIAAVALAEGCHIITKNSRHFERTGVPLENW